MIYHLGIFKIEYLAFFLSNDIFTVHSYKTMPPKEQSKLNDFNTTGMPSLIGPHVFRNRASRIRNWFLE